MSKLIHFEIRFFKNIIEQPKRIELILASVMIGLVGLMFYVLDTVGLNISSTFPILFSAFCVGVIASLYGISIRKGWRSILLLLIVSALSYGCTQLFV